VIPEELPPMADGSRRNPLLAIFTTVFIDLLGFGILLPVFPLLINPGSPYKVMPGSPQHGLILLGWLQAIFPFCIFIAAPVLGQLSDRFGRRPVLAFSIAGTSISYVLFAIGIINKNLPLLFFARAFDGLTGGNIAVAQAAIGDISTNENRAKNFGVLGAAFGLGFVIGPYLGGRLSAPNTSFYGLFHTPSWFSASTPFWFAAILAALNCMLILFKLPETLKTKDPNRKVELGRSFHNVAEGFASPRLRIPLLATLLFNGGFTFFTTFAGVYLTRQFKFTQSKTGDFFALIGIFIAISQGLLVGQVAKKLPDFKVLRFAFFGNAIAIFTYVWAKSTLPLYLTVPLFTAFNGLCMANLTSLVSRSAEMGKQGQAMGIYSSVQSFAQVIPAALVGYITAGIGSKTPLIVSSVVMALAGLAFVTLFRPTYVAAAQPGAPAMAH
jgi:MFS transporter, DHA1 family, tetracycline resistance protein